MNYVIAIKVFRLTIREAISVVIMTSQKSSPVALAVISYITDDPDQKGLFAVPCIIGQLTQIFIGSFVAKQFAKLVDAQDAVDRSAKEAAVAEAESKTEGVDIEAPKNTNDGENVGVLSEDGITGGVNLEISGVLPEQAATVSVPAAGMGPK
jgi:hypothetical protein